MSAHITFQLFAKARDLIDQTHVQIPIINTHQTIQDCIDKLQILYPALDNEFMTKCRLAYNQSYLRNYTTLVKPGDIYVIIPPISGG
jgi:molybdopterin converting factor small subunit